MLLNKSIIDNYQNDGVTVLRNIISIEWIFLEPVLQTKFGLNPSFATKWLILWKISRRTRIWNPFCSKLNIKPSTGILNLWNTIHCIKKSTPLFFDVETRLFREQLGKKITDHQRVLNFWKIRIFDRILYLSNVEIWAKKAFSRRFNRSKVKILAKKRQKKAFSKVKIWAKKGKKFGLN